MCSSPNPLLQLVPNRVEGALQRLKDRIWGNRTPLAVTATVPTAAHRPLAAVRDEARAPVAPGEAWGRHFDQRWYRLEFPAPTRGAAPPRYLEWRDQGEATLHVDGTPYYGFDVAHRYVALPPGAREAWVEAYCCQTAIWHPDATGLSPRGSLFDGAFLVTRDDAAWTAYHDLQALFDLMIFHRGQQAPAPRPLERFGHQPAVAQAAPVYRRLLHLLAGALDAFDTAGLPALRTALARATRELRTARPWTRAILTGHAHLDLVWLWPERIGEAKAVHLFATANRLMSLYPEYRFAYSQPASYRAVARLAPRLAAAVAARVAAGRWQPTGALDVESDTQLPCGEALARSFLLGQAEFARLRGSPAKLLWLPDVFGYSGCLPQLMRLAGVEWFFTTKLTWSAINRFPYSSFVWRGADGSEVVAHVTQNVGYNNRLDLDELDANARGHAQSQVHPEFLHPTGYGDGGGGPTEEMCERARRLDALAGLPALRWDQPEAFFARLARRRHELPVWRGECYLEYHRGVFTTHGELKAAFRGLERALQVREAVAVARGTAPDLTAVWRRLVFAQFHDYVPGSSIAEVYAEGVPELRALAAQQREAARAELTGDAADHVFNPLPLPWRGWLRHGDAAPRWLDLPPLASQPLASQPLPAAPVTARGRTLVNGLVTAELGADGWLRRLVLGGQAIPLTGPARAVLYPDFPANYDAWDIDRHTLALGEPVTTPARLRIVRAGPDAVTIEVARRLGHASRLTLRYRLEAGEPFLRLEAEIDWHEKNTLLKLHFPTACGGAQARFGAPFGSVLRGQQPGRPEDEAQWEVPGSRWAAVADDGERAGLALITEAKYGFLARAGDLSVSLLRSARITGQDCDRYAVPEGLSRHAPASPLSDQGRHVIRLALTRYDLLAETTAQPAALADTIFTTPLVYRGAPASAGLLGVADAPTLVPAWAVPVDADGWLLRLHEVGGQRGAASVQLATGWMAQPCGLDGRPLRPEQRPVGKAARIPYGPYQIVTLKITRVASGARRAA